MKNIPNNSAADEYLCVDEYLKDFLQTQVLKSAFDTGLIDLLLENPHLSLAQICDSLQMDLQGLTLLVDLLSQNGVLHADKSQTTLDTGFVQALNYRDLLETKIEFANYLAPDLLNYFNDYLQNMDNFMANSAVFDLFSYHRCYQPTEENLAATRRWMKYTSVLTRYEAGAFLDNYNISKYQSAMDIGGNSGEFMLQLCRANPDMRGTVVDLPVVCEIGQQHISGQKEADRIQFHMADALEDQLPGGFDLLTFKSILHDWPDEAVDTYISRAYDCLESEGDLVIFERVETGAPAAYPTYGNLPVFIFMRFYRNVDLYKRLLEKHNFNEIKIEYIQLEMPFVLISANKK